MNASFHARTAAHPEIDPEIELFVETHVFPSSVC